MPRISPQSMWAAVREQLAVDLNCTPEDFSREGLVFRPCRDNPGRRPFPRGASHLEMLTMGRAIIVSATDDLLPYLKARLKGKSRDEVFSMPFIRGMGLYLLPDLSTLSPLPIPDGLRLRLMEQEEIPALYAHEGFDNALGYDRDHPRPDILAVTAEKEGQVIGVAGASRDCDNLWQVGIDVLPEHRGGGLAPVLVSHLSDEILNRGKVPYYGVSVTNIPSQRTAHRSGYLPAWSCMYRMEFDGVLTQPTG